MPENEMFNTDTDGYRRDFSSPYAVDDDDFDGVELYGSQSFPSEESADQ